MLAAHLSSTDGLLKQLEMEAESLHLIRDGMRVLFVSVE
jgi:hypothetical protein